MTQDISGFGLQVTLIASNTFPGGLPITQFADDADAVDFPSIQVADKAMGLNGDLVTWSKAMPLPLTISVVPGSEDDENLSILANANRVGKGKGSAYDIITLNAIYPDGRQITFSGGKLTDAMFGNSVASAGRQKSKVYVFAFQNITGT